ncbi:MAG: membrane protein insertion efficiency factor YidD [Actinomycetota bacterium]|nr:membrane protein insertion efficiency factor YidD [Actinomycetota bacterium]
MKYVGIALVQAYRHTLGRVVRPSCKYHPSCSHYALDALRRYGLVRGSVLAGWRILRCNPWSDGGVDRVEDQTLLRGKLGWVRGATR